MKPNEIYYRIRHRVREMRRKQYKRPGYFKKYRSYRHKARYPDGDMGNLYLTETVSYGAGIGHQLANWIAGYWFAHYFGINYAYSPFTSSAVPNRPNRWDRVLGFGEGEVSAYQLLKDGYKKVQLPYFDENNAGHIEAIRRIIQSYAGQKAVFFTESNQFYHDQYGVMDEISAKFFSAAYRTRDQLIYDPDYYNIAIHIRRTVVIDSKVIEESEEQKAKRWTGNAYYEELLKTISGMDVGKPVRIHVFSTGKPEEFEAFRQYGDVLICSELDEYESFVHLVYADLLITSKSSFSYKPALISKGIKICPEGFWHGYPDRSDWFIVKESGKLTGEQTKRLEQEIRNKKDAIS